MVVVVEEEERRGGPLLGQFCKAHKVTGSGTTHKVTVFRTSWRPCPVPCGPTTQDLAAAIQVRIIIRERERERERERGREEGRKGERRMDEGERERGREGERERLLCRSTEGSRPKRI